MAWSLAERGGGETQVEECPEVRDTTKCGGLTKSKHTAVTNSTPSGYVCHSNPTYPLPGQFPFPHILNADRQADLG